MKIAVLTDRYPPHFEGGYEIMCHQIVEALRSRGHQVQVLVSMLGISGTEVSGNVYRTLNFLRFEAKTRLERRINQFKYFYKAQENYRRTKAFLSEVQPDLVFIWNIEGTSILPALAAQDMKFPCVYEQQSHWLVHLQKRYLEEPSVLHRQYRSAMIGFRRFNELQLDNIIFVSQSLKESHAQAGFPMRNPVVIPNGITEDFIPTAIEPRKRTQDQPMRLLFVGRLESEKGTEVAIRAVNQLIKQGESRLLFDIIGTGHSEYVSQLNRYIEENQLQNYIKLCGFMPREDLIKAYKNYDILLFPSLRWEGLPVVIVEAMAQGLTVIASDIGGPSDVITHEQDGFLIIPGDSDAMARVIQHLLTTPDLLDEIASHASETVRNCYTADIAINQIENYLLAVLAHASDRVN